MRTNPAQFVAGGLAGGGAVTLTGLSPADFPVHRLVQYLGPRLLSNVPESLLLNTVSISFLNDAL